MGLISGLVSFVIGVFVGGFGIYVGSQLVVGEGDYAQAVTTALVGAVVWGLIDLFIGSIPLLGPLFAPLVAFAAYLTVLNAMYPGDWIEAFGIALVAWLTLLFALLVLRPFGLGWLSGVGVPGI